MTSTVEALWLFDLDGTVLTVNSFPLWAAEMLLGRLPYASPGQRLSVAARCAAALARRKLLHDSHARLRRTLQQLWTEDPPGRSDARATWLVERLAGHVRPSLHAVLDDVACGRADAILTTAAAAEYAVPLARRLGFRHVIATPGGGRTDSMDNSGEIKRERTLAYIEALGWSGRSRILFADTADDLPLAGACDALVWLGAATDVPELPPNRSGARGLLLAADIHSAAAHDWVINHSGGAHACT